MSDSKASILIFAFIVTSVQHIRLMLPLRQPGLCVLLFLNMLLLWLQLLDLYFSRYANGLFLDRLDVQFLGHFCLSRVQINVENFSDITLLVVERRI